MPINTLDDFIKVMPKDLNSIIEKARHLYLELGKRSFYDTEYKYFMFGEEDSYIGYSSKSYSEPNIIICTTLAKQFVELLSKAGIRAELVYEDGHYSVGFYDEEGRYHIADITNDLKNIQFGCRTTYFGADTISSKTIKQIDIKLGYITEKKGYSDDYWYTLRDILQESDLSEKRKLDIVLQNIQKFGDITKPGDAEIFYIYQKFVRYCLPNRSGITFLSSKTGRYEKEKCFIELYSEGNKINYLLNPKTRLFEEQARKGKKNKSAPEAPNFPEGSER